MNRIIGIDLGTTNSCVAVQDGAGSLVIHNRQGGRTLPSVVAMSEEGRRMVGVVAMRQAAMNPERTIFGVKRLIGRKFNAPEVESWRVGVPYEVVPADNGDAWVRIGKESMSPQEVSALILKEIKALAEEYLGEPVNEAVVTVPAYFNDNQRQATKDAGVIAGLQIQKIINEPTAAALGYGLHQKRDQRMAVFDLGGGTFDITIMQSSNGVFEVLSTCGDTFLGGEDFNQRLVRHLAEAFSDENNVNLRDDPCALQRLMDEVEIAKCELSTSLTTAINIPFIAMGPDGPLHLLHDPLERRLLERLTADLLERIEAPCYQALEDAGLGSEDLDVVLLVGGMTRMPAVQQKVEAIFGKSPAKNVNPDEIVALGAATQCGIMTGEVQEVVLLDVTPHSLGIRVKDGRMSVVIDKNTTVPTSERKVFSTTEDYQDFVTIEVFQGEAERVRDNTLLGQFQLEGLPRKRAGEVHVEVTFLIDADGILDITAKEMQTGQQTSVTITPAGGLTDEQRERLRSSLP